MNIAKRLFWYLVVLGAFIPSIMALQYLSIEMGVPSSGQILLGIWVGLSIWLIADRTFKPYTP